MSNYGAPGGPYRDQPQDPWQGRPPQDPYDQPSDPWGEQDGWGGDQASVPPGGPGSPVTGHDPGYGAGGYGAGHGYDQAPGPRYGQASGPGYDQGPAPGYGRTPGQGYGHSSGPGYGERPAPGYGQTPGPGQGATHPQQGGYGQGHGQGGYGHGQGHGEYGQGGHGQERTYHDDRGYDAGYPHAAPQQATQMQPVSPRPAPPPPPPVWSQPVPAAPPRRSTGLFVLVGVVILVLAGGIGFGLYLLGNDDPGKNAGSPTAGPSTPAADDPTGDPTPSAADSSTDARFAAKGQCLVNKGTAKKPVMQITSCAPGTYQVLARFDGTKDYEKKCGNGKVPGYQYYYFFDSDLDTLDFVLCLKKR